jgi:hypothetical protein
MQQRTLALSLITTLFIVGCGTKETVSMAGIQPTTPSAKEIQNKLKDAPKWVFDQTNDKYIIGVGSSQPTKAGFSFQKK